MTAFSMLPPSARALFALWALLICLCSIGSAVLAAVSRRFRFAALACVLLAPAYFIWQVIFDLSLFGGTERGAGISGKLGGLAWICWFAAFVLLTLAAARLLFFNMRYDRTFLTPGAIKLFLDQIPCGVCCWRGNGRVLFSNVCMNRLCSALTGGPLLNGNQFHDAVKDGIQTAEGRVWRFSCREIDFGGAPLHEMIASDVTNEYAETQTLEQDKAELSQLNRELREYYRSIDEVTRRREILQARVNIHDEMNRLMLSTTAAGREDTAALDRIFSLWEQNALLLGLEAERNTDARAADSLEKLAAALNIRLIWQNTLPDSLSDAQRGLFFSAAQEAIANAVKHADAKTVRISFSETETEIRCRFANDGSAPTEAVRFTGGLANLSLLAARQGARVSAEQGDAFAVILCIPKEHCRETHQPIG